MRDDDIRDSVSPDYFQVSPGPASRWGLALVAVMSAVVMSAAIAAGALILVRHDADRRAALNDAAALGSAREFITTYTTLDPLDANAYADRVLALSTGEFAKLFEAKREEILARVARSEPTAGTVLEAGVQRWNDDGSADVLLATKIAKATPDGESTEEIGSRWVATAVKEGQHWKISNLVQVI
ncbi:MAG: mammalian cell entry protein [Actinomycetia bacterium]|nr:mammalian cell entry protein [Actinomycetes bacterium]MCH9767417.1 mammalian cell entry protein [Actinomycetes bacterium]